LDIFQELFFQRALIGGLLIGLVSPLMGVFLVLRRLSMFGDTLSHITIAGVALGFLLNVYPLVVGLVVTVLASFAIEYLRKTYKTYAELSMAIMMSGGVALATFLFTIGNGFNINVMSYFFGSIYTLNHTDLWFIFFTCLAIILVVFFHFKELFLIFFDEDAARVSGLPIAKVNMIIMILTALVIAISIKIVGALLVSALLTIPAACSLMIAKSFKHAILFAIVISEVAVFIGLTLAGIWDLAPGSTIVLSLILLLLMVMGSQIKIKHS
jgi:zinc transport system permease protein